MQHLSHPRRPRARLRTAALLPVAVVAWLTLGTGMASAAPSTHAAANATAQSANGNGQANGPANGPDNGQDNGAATGQATSGASDNSGGSSDHSSGNAGTSGDPSQPQPQSNADQNSGGANGKCLGGPYCSTRDGSASGNGNGTGKATGKPCAGCVGKADNKNPKGQYPNGSDHNAGYECDRNHGIGRTNPAHTGCTSTPPPCDSTTQDCGNGGGGCDSTTEDCGGGSCDSTTTDCGQPGCTTDADCGTPPPACVPTAANNFCSTVEGEHHTRKPPTKVLGEKVTRTPSALPFTGAAGIGIMISTAALAMAAGGGLMIAARRRRGQVG
jgi:hypothetical protein